MVVPFVQLQKLVGPLLLSLWTGRSGDGLPMGGEIFRSLPGAHSTNGALCVYRE